MMTDCYSELVTEKRFPTPIYITHPTMPPLEDYVSDLKIIWESGWLTNNGPYHKELERRLVDHLQVPYISLFNNGTLALLLALQVLRLNHGEVITTPFTFAATTHTLHWNGITPVFCDIEPDTLNIDPERIEALITPQTTAIIPVHVYGSPCDIEAIRDIADRHGLRVIYDAAHAFGVKVDDHSILEEGDISMVSFHATKLFSTIEGGALITSDENVKKRLDFLKNFGIADEEHIIAPGINAKMNEFQAAFGLLELRQLEEEIQKRAELTRIYREIFAEIPGIKLVESQVEGVQLNYSYAPILIDEVEFGIDRDTVYKALQEFNIYARKHFYPLTSQYPCYNSLPSANPTNLPIATRVADQVLCLPLYGKLSASHIYRICEILEQLQQ
jgi:dTDP-4-amino-4,6-dideoxygalactose transaminase